MNVAMFLYDDAAARKWDPFVLTRPVGELLMGCSLLRERAEACWGVRCAGHVTDPELAGFAEDGAPPVVDAATLDTRTTRLLLNSRVAWGSVEVPPFDRKRTLMVEGEVAGWILPPDATPPPPDALSGDEPWSEGRVLGVDGRFLGEPWDLVAHNAGVIPHQADSLGLYRLAAQDGVVVLGDADVFAGPDAVVEPGVVIDVREGPVVLDRGARAQGPARLTGPLYVGPGSTVLGGFVGHSSIGPGCKVRGEVSESVISGYANKAHDGHLGHALLGRWVNLGAGTTNSDLKNTYGEVRVDRGRDPEPTGMLKVGCFLGDYVRTGIGTLLPTGAVIGSGSNVFGGAVPRYVPPFTWAHGGTLTDYRLEGFLGTARTVMARRHQELDEATATLLQRAWKRTEPLRRSRGVAP